MDEQRHLQPRYDYHQRRLEQDEQQPKSYLRPKREPSDDLRDAMPSSQDEMEDEQQQSELDQLLQDDYTGISREEESAPTEDALLPGDDVLALLENTTDPYGFSNDTILGLGDDGAGRNHPSSLSSFLITICLLIVGILLCC